MCAGDLVWLYIIICNETKTRKCVPYDVKNHIRIVYIYEDDVHTKGKYISKGKVQEMTETSGPVVMFTSQ